MEKHLQASMKALVEPAKKRSLDDDEAKLSASSIDRHVSPIVSRRRLKKTKQVEGEIDNESDDSVVSSSSLTEITKAMEHLEARSGG